MNVAAQVRVVIGKKVLTTDLKSIAGCCELSTVPSRGAETTQIRAAVGGGTPSSCVLDCS